MSAYEHGIIEFTSLLAVEADILETVNAVSGGQVSGTPDAPILVRIRPDVPGMWELCDGHHRVAAALLDGKTRLPAAFDNWPDDEPLEPPFFDFAAFRIPVTA